MNNHELKEYFHMNRPNTSDETTYLAELSAKMDTVAEIKRIIDASKRKYRMICAATFAIGCALGITVIAFILLKPFSIPQFKTDIFLSLYSFAYEWRTVLVLVVATTSILLGLSPWKKGAGIHR